MRRAVRGAVCGLACLLAVALSGCQTLNVDQTIEIPSVGAVKRLDVSAPGGEQKVSVTITADEPISAYLLTATKDNEEAVTDAFVSRPADGPAKKFVLGGDVRKKEISFEAIVPARTASVLLITSDKPTKAHVKMVSK